MFPNLQWTDDEQHLQNTVKKGCCRWILMGHNWELKARHHVAWHWSKSTQTTIWNWRWSLNVMLFWRWSQHFKRCWFHHCHCMENCKMNILKKNMKKRSICFVQKDQWQTVCMSMIWKCLSHGDLACTRIVKSNGLSLSEKQNEDLLVAMMWSDEGQGRANHGTMWCCCNH